MGGLASGITSLADKIAGEALEGLTKWGKEEAPSLLSSTRSILEKTPIGKVWSDYITNTIEPRRAQIGQSLLKSKLAAGIAPGIAAKESGIEAIQQARKQFLGPNDEALVKFIHTAKQQHGVPYGNNVADAMGVYFRDSVSRWRTMDVKVTPGQPAINLAKSGIRSTSNYISPTENEKGLRRSLGWMMTPLIAIPHTAQMGNVVFDTSIKSVAKSLSEYLSTGPSKVQFQQDLLNSGVLFDEMRNQMLEDAKGGGLARKLFNHPGFGWVRRQQISISAGAGKFAAIDAAAKLTRDPSDKWARHTLGKLGIDTTQLSGSGQLTPEQIQKAMYSEANRSIFLSHSMETPYKWEENWFGRMDVTYKHFAFRQGKFLKDGFRDAYEYGGAKELAKTVAIYGTLFPAFGELVHTMENVASGQNPLKRDKDDPASEYFDALGYAGGWAIFYSMWRSGTFNAGRGFLEGPFFNMLDDVFIGGATDLMHHDKDGDWDPKIKHAAHRVTTKLGVPGKLISPMLKDDKEDK